MKRWPLAVAAVVVLFGLQYLALSNTGAGVYIYFSDTWPYSKMNSYLPLPRSVNRAMSPLFAVLRFPFEPVMRQSQKPPVGRGTLRWAATLMTPFGNSSQEAIKKNHFVFAAVNSALWSLGALVLVAALRAIRRMSSPREVHAEDGGA